MEISCWRPLRVLGLHLFMNLQAFKGDCSSQERAITFTVVGSGLSGVVLRGGLRAGGVALISSTSNCLGKWWPAVGTMLRLLALLILVKQLMNLVEQRTNCICNPHHVVQ